MENMKKQVESILIEVKEEIKDHLDGENFISDGYLDSLDIMNVIMKIEDVFDIEIDPEDVLSENFESVDAMIRLIEKCKK